MSRIDIAKKSLIIEFEKYKQDNPKAKLNIESQESLSALMDNLFNRLEFDTRKKKKQPNTELRRCLADYLLLLDDFDIKNVSCKSDIEEYI